MTTRRATRRRAPVVVVRCSGTHQRLLVLGLCALYAGFLSWSLRGDPTAALPAAPRIHHQHPPNEPSVVTIGVASTITACGSEPFTEGAAVLQHSLELTSFRGPKGGKYDYKMHLLYHPDARECAEPLGDLGFELLERPTPINVSDIKGDILRERLPTNGCCGERELIKLEAYRLTSFPVVIHLDLDVLVLQPMDDAIDLILHPPMDSNHTSAPIMWPDQPIPEEVSLVFTKDYNVVPPPRKDKPFQGGFFMIRPSLETYREFLDIVLEGDYRDTKGHTGWGGVVGPFWGGMTIQGLLPWYYEYLHPNRTVELNRCVYNNIADNPTNKETKNDTAQGRCRTNQETCEDCRRRDIREIVTFHYTACFKPWTCSPQKQDRVQMRLCHRAHHEWFRYRRDLEESWGRNGTGPATFMASHFLGHCNRSGYKGYNPIRLPYGKP